jgi:hypothetical protein
VYLPPEISLTGGRVLKMMYLAPFLTATSAIVLPLLYSISKPSGPKEGVVMAKTVCAPVKAVSREARLNITLDDFDLLLELLGLLRVDITGDGTDLVLLGELWIVRHIVND